jgi:hypothetical protein
MNTSELVCFLADFERLLSNGGVAIKHINVIGAASRSLGHANWYAADYSKLPIMLKLSPMTLTGNRPWGATYRRRRPRFQSAWTC